MILQQDHIQMENNVWHQNLDVPGKDVKKIISIYIYHMCYIYHKTESDCLYTQII